jgi:hypothetical protein
MCILVVWLEAAQQFEFQTCQCPALHDNRKLRDVIARSLCGCSTVSEPTRHWRLQAINSGVLTAENAMARHCHH